MARASIDSATRTELTGLGMTVAELLKIDFPGGALLCNMYGGPVTYDSETYENNGLWLSMSGIEERAGKPPMASLTMAAAGDMKTAVAAGGYRRSRVERYTALIDVSDGSIIGAFARGVFRIGKIALQRSGSAYAYQVTCASVLEDGFRAHPVYPANNMQQDRYSDDTFFAASAIVPGYEGEWGGDSFRIGGHSGCVAVDERIDGKRAGDILTGDALRIADPDTLEPGIAEVLYSGRSLQPGVRIVTETGRTLRCSESAPIATDSGLLRAKPLLHYGAVVEGGGYEEVIAVEPLGEILVQHIYLGERCFWVNGFLHHNKLDPVPRLNDGLPVRGGGEVAPVPRSAF